MSNHLWYLSEEAVGFSFFDPNVSIAEKRKMVVAMQASGGDESEEVYIPKRVVATAAKIRKEFKSMDLSAFVTENTMKFFKRDIGTDFLAFDPILWNSRQDHKSGAEFCYNIQVVNDVAERGVKLMSDFNNILVKQEEDKQFLLQMVALYRKELPSFDKSKLQDN